MPVQIRSPSCGVEEQKTWARDMEQSMVVLCAAVGIPTTIVRGSIHDSVGVEALIRNLLRQYRELANMVDDSSSQDDVDDEDRDYEEFQDSIPREGGKLYASMVGSGSGDCSDDSSQPGISAAVGTGKNGASSIDGMQFEVGTGWISKGVIASLA